jgi:PAS domain S-box-containing protein
MSPNPPALPADEAERLRALHAYGILDTPSEQAFDDIARIAGCICGTPVSVISLVDEARQWFKSRLGMELEETSREVSFCAHTILSSEVLEISDSWLDPRFVDNPLVTGDPHIRFYAGAPLIDPEGHRLGALCVVDRMPRKLTAEQREMLLALARQVVAQLEVRRDLCRLEALMVERQRTGRRLSAQFATSWALTLPETLEEAAPLLLGEIGTSLGWAFGALWRVDRTAERLACVEVWNDPRFAVPELAAATRGCRLELGSGLAGRAWAQGAPVWIDDATHDPTALAALHGMRGAFAVPIEVQGWVVAVLELYSPLPEPRDSDLLETMVGLGHQIGQFVERAEAQEALRASEARARAIVDSSLAGVITCDERGSIESVNPAVEALFGYSRDELVGQDVRILLPETAAGSVLLSARSVGRETEGQGRRKNGDLFPFVLAVSAFTTAEGRRFAGSIRDLSERHEVERLKREFVSTVSHELRTPLTSIRGSLGLLAVGAMGELPAEALEVIGIADRNCVRLIGLINDVLDLERMQTGKLDMTFSAVAVAAVVRRSLEAVEGLAEAAEVTLVSDDSRGIVWGDEARLVQVLVNLLSNAVKFSPRGAMVAVTTSSGLGFEEVRVRDHGRGIPPRFQRSIFERFQQVEASDSREKGGTGLGLAISKAILTSHHGTIGLESQEGRGSTFWIRLPQLGETA